MSVWTVADKNVPRRGNIHVTLSEEAVSAGTNPKTLNWNSTDVPGLDGLYNLPMEILGVRCEFTPTSATSRRMKLQVQDSAGDIINEVGIQSAQTSTALALLQFDSGYPPGTGAVELPAAGGPLRNPLPVGLILLPGQKLLATQDTIVDANDALVVHVRARLLRP